MLTYSIVISVYFGPENSIKERMVENYLISTHFCYEKKYNKAILNHVFEGLL